MATDTYRAYYSRRLVGRLGGKCKKYRVVFLTRIGSQMKCEKCGLGVDAGPLYRMNDYGVIGTWRHSRCGGVPCDPIVADIVNHIYKDNKTRFDAPHPVPHPEAG